MYIYVYMYMFILYKYLGNATQMHSARKGNINATQMQRMIFERNAFGLHFPIICIVYIYIYIYIYTHENVVLQPGAASGGSES